MVVTWRRRAKFAAVVVVEVVVAVAVVAVAVVDLSCVVAVLQLDPGWRRIEQQREGSPTSGLLCPRLKVYEVIL